jgi:hypothetical protein
VEQVSQAAVGSNANHSGVTGISFTIPKVKETAPEYYELTKHGSVFSYSDGKAPISQQIGDGGIAVACWTVYPESWMDNMPFGLVNTETGKTDIREIFKS